MAVLGATLGATFRLKKVGWLCCVALLKLFGSCTTTKFRKPASRWLSSFPGSGKHQHGMLRPRGIAIGCFKFAPRTTCAGPPTAVANVLSPFPHKITDARAWATVIESEMTRASIPTAPRSGKTPSAICCNAIGPSCPARRKAATRSGTGLRASSEADRRDYGCCFVRDIRRAVAGSMLRSGVGLCGRQGPEPHLPHVTHVVHKEWGVHVGTPIP